ncbi:hypothetical protein [Winogradskyella aurantia]|uniref:VWA domain-containing protein n=1 Tax=Winogradskyella aurantia TaxID=1915063 RepID=A0A265UT72_9FLAO|nr:hypothetical protein [Winogradskyella aurantia]OZV68515.1 hypothetical protein CA834_08550 [Winogradskyella aurantia]
MQTSTLVYIGIAGIAALLLALFQYIYKSKLRANLRYALFGLRAVTIFAVLLLLINPKLQSFTYFNEKPDLVLAVDNSESISYLGQGENALSAFNEIISNKDLKNRFHLHSYSFGKDLNSGDSLRFNEGQSNISKAFKQLGEIYSNSTAPVILVTDGNQTYGADYSYSSKDMSQPVFPVILGDSTLYADLSIKQLNVNRYVFLKNRFPVEIIVNYSGKDDVNTELKIWSGNQIVFSKPIQLSESKTSEIISATLLAKAVGVRTYRAEITPIDNEQNKVNNTKNFGVEVIDQKTNIAIVAERLHPDLGAIKKAIESNEQRKVSILDPQEYISKYNDFQLVILYQPNSSFNTILETVKKKKLNAFTITGTTTDWNLLNKAQNFFKQAVTNQTEEYQPILNSNYSNFIINDIDFNDYPPLKSEFGEFGINIPHEVILYKSVNGINTNQILLATFEAEGTKQAILNGENIWRWRAQTFLNTESFNNFDNFVNKIVQYLSSNKKRNRLNIDYKSFYNGSDDVIITAQYFNKNYEFDSNGALSIALRNKNNGAAKEVPLLLSDGNYRVDLSGIEPGTYQFTISHNFELVSATGEFQVLEYNVEQQFLNADIDKLNLLADNSSGQVFYSNEVDQLINALLSDNRFATIQKSTKNIVPLIEWKYLLIIIALSLFFEWFIRKYNGLI